MGATSTPADVAAEVAAALAAADAAGRAAWPELGVAAPAFAAHLRRHLPEAGGAAAVRALRAADLYLACACAAGDAAAIAAFERTYFGEIAAAAARHRAGSAITADVTAELRALFFVAAPPRAAGVADYAGRGDLRGWVRVAATRAVLHRVKKVRRELAVTDESLFDVLSPADDPELGYLADLYRQEFAAAFQTALAAASDRDRSLLRYSLLEGLTIDEIGGLHGVHRSTAARWLEAARDGILERTRDDLKRRLQAGSTEVDSLIRLVHSRIDVSLERVLGAE
jgi:RNA polymerase sigma-70 factor (ECF subfamily)